MAGPVGRNNELSLIQLQAMKAHKAIRKDSNLAGQIIAAKIVRDNLLTIDSPKLSKTTEKRLAMMNQREVRTAFVRELKGYITEQVLGPISKASDDTEDRLIEAQERAKTKMIQIIDQSKELSAALKTQIKNTLESEFVDERMATDVLEPRVVVSDEDSAPAPVIDTHADVHPQPEDAGGAEGADGEGVSLGRRSSTDSTRSTSSRFSELLNLDSDDSQASDLDSVRTPSPPATISAFEPTDNDSNDLRILKEKIQAQGLDAAYSDNEIGQIQVLLVQDFQTSLSQSVQAESQEMLIKTSDDLLILLDSTAFSSSAKVNILTACKGVIDINQMDAGFGDDFRAKFLAAFDQIITEAEQNIPSTSEKPKSPVFGRPDSPQSAASSRAPSPQTDKELSSDEGAKSDKAPKSPRQQLIDLKRKLDRDPRATLSDIPHKMINRLVTAYNAYKAQGVEYSRLKEYRELAQRIGLKVDAYGVMEFPLGFTPRNGAEYDIDRLLKKIGSLETKLSELSTDEERAAGRRGSAGEREALNRQINQCKYEIKEISGKSTSAVRRVIANMREKIADLEQQDVREGEESRRKSSQISVLKERIQALRLIIR